MRVVPIVRKNLIRNALFFGMALVFLSACTPTIEEVAIIETRTIRIPKPAPIVPTADQLKLRSVEWKIVTPENIDEVFASLSTDNIVLFAITSDGYEALALNLSDLRAHVQQQQKIIAIYRDSYDR